MPTICIDCRYIGPRPSGIAEVVRGLIEHAPALAPELDFILLKGPRSPNRLTSSPNVTERVVPFAPNSPAGMWLLSRRAELQGVDLFHAPSNILPTGLHMPCVTTIHDLMWLTEPQLCHHGRLGRLERAFYAYGLRRAIARSAAVATVSAATRDSIAAYAPHAVERCHLTLSGVAQDFRPIHRAPSVLRSLGLDPARRFVLTVGQNAPYKNHAGALSAFAEAFGERSEFDMVFVQRRGASANALMQQALGLGLSDRVIFPPPLSREQLVQLYCSAEALLHPSFCEGFGNPLAEAMASGCPVVTSDRSAMPEVTDGAALLANPDDPHGFATCLRRIVDEPDLALQLREKGLARAAKLTWQSFAAANVAIYRQLLA